MEKHPVPTRAELRKAAKVTPIEDILGHQVTKALTPKQRRFAKGVAEGKTKASAYREAYKANPAPATILHEPYRLAADPRIAAEIQAYALAIESAKQRTPAALRELVIHGLVQVALDPEAKNAERIAALKTLGTVTEVAAFTERRETRTISSSEDARKAVMLELTRLMGANASTVEDAKVIGEADELLRELAGTHPTGTPPDAQPESPLDTHTIPPKRSDNFSSPHESSANFSSDNFSTPGESDNFLTETPPPQSGDTPR
jgi:hypothetical protein